MSFQSIMLSNTSIGFLMVNRGQGGVMRRCAITCCGQFIPYNNNNSPTCYYSSRPKPQRNPLPKKRPIAPIISNIISNALQSASLDRVFYTVQECFFPVATTASKKVLHQFRFWGTKIGIFKWLHGSKVDLWMKRRIGDGWDTRETTSIFVSDETKDDHLKELSKDFGKFLLKTLIFLIIIQNFKYVFFFWLVAFAIVIIA